MENPFSKFPGFAQHSKSEAAKQDLQQDDDPVYSNKIDEFFGVIKEGIARAGKKELVSSKIKAFMGDTKGVEIPSDSNGGVFSEKDLASMPHSELYTLRQKYAGNKEAQEVLAPFEHRAYAREKVEESPTHAISLIPAIPGYQLAKMTPAKSLLSVDDQPVTPPSIDQYIEGYRGVYEGLKKAVQ